MVLLQQLRNRFTDMFSKRKVVKLRTAVDVGCLKVIQCSNPLIKTDMKPFGHRSSHSNAARAASGEQSVGRAMPQLILDGPNPGEHVQAAMKTCHPMQLPPTLSQLVGYATKYGILDDSESNHQREAMLQVVTHLAAQVDNEKHMKINLRNVLRKMY